MNVKLKRVLLSLWVILAITGCESEISSSNKPNDNNNETKPEFTLTKSFDNTVRVSWLEDDSTATYVVELSDSPNFNSISTQEFPTLTSQYLIEDTIEGVTNYVRVKLIDSNNQVYYSDFQTFNGDVQKPKNVVNTKAGSAISLSWEGTADSFNIYWSTHDDVSITHNEGFKTNVLIPLTSINFTEIQATGNVYFIVTKVIRGIEGPASDSILVIIDNATWQDQITDPNNIFDQSIYNSLGPDNIARGGLLYDKWWNVSINSTEPAADQTHPFWPVANTAITGSGTWRCKECHGWDYRGRDGAYREGKHFTGIAGIVESATATMVTRTPEEIYTFLITRTDHGFADNFLTKIDYYDLTKFIATMRSESDSSVASFNFIDDTSKLAIGADLANGKTLYENIDANCILCHGFDGKQIDFGTNKFVHNIAQDNPWEFVHKVRFGQPKSLMQGLIKKTETVNSMQAAIDILGYAQTSLASTANTNLPESDFNLAIYNSQGTADVVRGGLLYDKWWLTSAVASEPAAGIDHQLWPAENTAVSGSATWRCKECHGWDYRGRDGAYSSGKHYTGFPGVVNTPTAVMKAQTPEAVYSWLKYNIDHGFAGAFFTDDEYYDLTKFIISMRAEASVSQASFNFIDDLSKRAINSNITSGKSLFEGADAGCSVCHGPDGRSLPFGEGVFVHTIANDNPWEFIHKVRFGQPATAMTGAYAKQSSVNTIQAAVDILGYAQNALVPDVKRAGLLYDKWWETLGVQTPSVPAGRNPIWSSIPEATTDPTLVSDSSTWRCKECHGWDYLGVDGAYGDINSKHYSGIQGFIANSLGKTKESLVAAIANGVCNAPCGPEGHSFSQYLSLDDINMLADFILNLAPSSAYNAALNSTDVTSGQTVYKSNTPGHCEGCHGVDGNNIPIVNVSNIAISDPQEFLHKVRYGQPGPIMVPESNVGFVGLTLQQAGDVLAYAKSLGGVTSVPGTGPSPQASYESASLVRGGLLYDKWWKVKQATDPTTQVPTGINPFYQEALAVNGLPQLPADKESNSWRCKSCHAWNYEGVGYTSTRLQAGSNADNLLAKINNRRSDTFAGNEAGLRQHLFDWIQSGLGFNHNFGEPTLQNPTPLNEQDIWDLVKFLLDGGLVDSSKKIMASGPVIDVDVVTGGALYNGSANGDVNCSVCHGANGAIPPVGDPLDIFAIATDDPWEVLHKIRFGQPGTLMPALEGIPTLNLNDAYNMLGYMQQKFQERPPIQ